MSKKSPSKKSDKSPKSSAAIAPEPVAVTTAAPRVQERDRAVDLLANFISSVLCADFVAPLSKMEELNCSLAAAISSAATLFPGLLSELDKSATH